MQVKEGLKKGIGSFKHSKKNSLFLAVVNSVIFVLGLGTVVGIAGAIAFLIFRNQGGFDVSFSTQLMLILGAFFMIFIIAFQVLSAFFSTYRQFTWTRLFLHIENQGNEPSKLEGAQT